MISMIFDEIYDYYMCILHIIFILFWALIVDHPGRGNGAVGDFALLIKEVTDEGAIVQERWTCDVSG